MTVPDWNNAQVLPPIFPGKPGNSPDRSPYRVSMAAMVARFATSPERIRILHGLLDYRIALSKTIISDGFQWLDGSFMENKELIEGKPPNDVDVVTFFELPEDKTQDDLLGDNPDLFDNESVKARFKVDSYMHQIGGLLKQFDVRRISYWYSMWSHRRDERWKGFLEVTLSDAENSEAKALLEQIEREGAQS
jgi:hypothetical protein